VSRCYSIRTCSISVTPWPCSADAVVNCSSVTQLARLRWTGHTAAAGSLCGEWGWGSVVRIRGLMRTQHFRICTSLVCGMSDSQQLARICVCGSVRFGSGWNKFVQLLIRSRNSSGRFVRSLLVSVSGAPKCQCLDQAWPFRCALAQGWLLQMKLRGPNFT